MIINGEKKIIILIFKLSTKNQRIFEPRVKIWQRDVQDKLFIMAIKSAENIFIFSLRFSLPPSFPSGETKIVSGAKFLTNAKDFHYQQLLHFRPVI